MENITKLPINKLNASSGWYWINEGFRYFSVSKINWITTLFIIAFVSLFLNTVAPIFQVLLLIIIPFFSAGIALACADIEKGGKMHVGYLAKAIQSTNKLNLLRYGFWLIFLIIIAQMINSLIMSFVGINLENINNQLIQLRENQQMSFAKIFESTELSIFFIMSFVMMLPIMVINLLSPILLVFKNISAMQAIKLSFIAVIKNLSSFIVYGLVFLIILFLLIVFFKLFIALLLTIFGETSKIALLIYIFVLTVAVLIVASLSYSSAFVAYKDIFLEK